MATWQEKIWNAKLFYIETQSDQPKYKYEKQTFQFLILGRINLWHILWNDQNQEDKGIFTITERDFQKIPPH